MNQTITHKTCKTCNTSKLLSDFWSHGECKLGLNPNCKECAKRIIKFKIKKVYLPNKFCNGCGQTKSRSQFHKRKGAKNELAVRSKCIECDRIKGKKRNHNVKLGKIDMVNYMGGGCIKCGYKNPEAIDFHHIDPSKKEFIISDVNAVNPLKKEKIVKELQKCAPLCKNCHAEFHAGRFLLGPYLHKIPKFNENTEKQNPIGDELILGLQISFVD
jgi:hypothetical protein